MDLNPAGMFLGVMVFAGLMDIHASLAEFTVFLNSSFDLVAAIYVNSEGEENRSTIPFALK